MLNHMDVGKTLAQISQDYIYSAVIPCTHSVFCLPSFDDFVLFGKLYSDPGVGPFLHSRSSKKAEDSIVANIENQSEQSQIKR